ncbi:MAG: tetratricopeptide repeat protein, partial [Phycisphaerae bacterium]
YLVMEYIEGRPIDRYCGEHRLSTIDRLELFRTICSAVHYAHQGLVVHRDIKPSNILVTEEGRPKLLDFGVAKILRPDRPAGTRGTAATTVRFLTPEYASPEQIRGEPITTATDVYSLGVVLYELLTGYQPYRFRTRAPQEIERVICEEEPIKPSTAVRRRGTQSLRTKGSGSSRTPETISRIRKSKPDKLRRRLAGDLDTIVLMALRKEPARRYVSAQQFSEDIRRHLTGLPVLARKDTLRYRGAKFVRRHRTGVIAACAVVLALVVGIVGMTREAHRAQAQADNANRAMAGLLRLVKTFDPTAGIGSRATFRQILDHGADNAARELEEYPEAQVEFMEAVAGVYTDLSAMEKAVEWRRRVVEVQRALLGDEDPAVLESRQMLGQALCRNRQHEEAETILREILTKQREQLGHAHPAVADTLWELACALYGKKGRYDEAEPLFRKAMDIDRKVYPDPDPVLIDRLLQLGGFLQSKGDYEEAETLLEEALDQVRRLRPADDYLRASVVGVLGAFLHDTSRFTEAEPYRRECLKISRQLYPEDHPANAANMEQLGLLLKDMERYEEAEPLIRQALEIKRNFYGEENVAVGYSYHCLAKVLTDAGKLSEAEEACRKSLELHLQFFPRDHR